MAGHTYDLGVLQTHTQQLGGVADQLEDALSDALQAELPQDAFGPLGAPIAELVKPLAQAAQEAFTSGVSSVRASTASMHATVREYDETEQANAAAFRAGMGGA
ncbi:hypothetical protein F0L68_12265 [Solihabitans fulvus]|uniref:Excreted virulence factor EspC, type VII ESX diderm n=1 Tax=Solihabitans fulvus TaxID=1892852 RepID=A0A5B2XHL1_9PSEU|nr:hypothetical protein [Solihabitans fulvus]KAA2262664.1 hypothetical protein F0L68_12265 [Solihabitans fulvus]